MQYALMIYAEHHDGDVLSDEEREAVRTDFLALTEDPRCVAHAQLPPVESATSVRVVGGRTLITDGPFADTKEVLGGVCLIDAVDLDEALEFASRVPVVRFGGVVEVRPLVQP